MINKDDYIAWRDDPVTQFYLHALWKKREFTKEGIANDEADLISEIHKHIGRCIAYQEAIDYATRDFEYLDEREIPSD